MKRWPLGASTYIWTSPYSTRRLDLIDRVADLGFDLIEICLEAPDEVDADKVSARLERAGIRATICGAFGPRRDISSTDAGLRAEGLRYISDCVDIAERVGATMVAGPMYAATGRTRLASAAEKRQQWKWAVENLRRAADYAGARGIRLAIEPLNRFETDFINTVEQALELLRRIGCDNVGLLLDTFHMNIEERSIAEAIRHAGRNVFHFHTCANDRGIPGRDHLPWTEIVSALSRTGYDGACVIEAFTPDNKEIARAVSLWRPLADTQDQIAIEGRRFLRRRFKGGAPSASRL
jgi:D-psicose/D-tagatose/L-ribulose 3-epimerase